jgi:hypothetical protein
MRKLGLALVMGLLATPLIASAASAAACVTGTVASYEALGATGCTVGGVTFADINVSTTVSGSGAVTLGNFIPVINLSTGEFGLQLTYSANTGATAGSSADVAWTYQVSGNLLSDVVMSFTGAVGTGSTAVASESLTNGTTLQLLAPGTTSATFAPVANLGVIKDQNDFNGSCTPMNQAAGTCGSSSSILENDFSLTSATPIPGALPLFATGLVGFWGLRKKRSKQNASLQAA